MNWIPPNTTIVEHLRIRKRMPLTLAFRCVITLPHLGWFPKADDYRLNPNGFLAKWLYEALPAIYTAPVVEPRDSLLEPIVVVRVPLIQESVQMTTPTPKTCQKPAKSEGRPL